MRTLVAVALMAVVVVVIGCGSSVDSLPGANKVVKQGLSTNNEVRPVGSTSDKTVKDAAVLEDARVGDELMKRLSKEAIDAKNADGLGAIRRLQAVEKEFRHMAKAGDVSVAVAWRRQQLEGKTIAELAVDHRDHPFPPSP